MRHTNPRAAYAARTTQIHAKLAQLQQLATRPSSGNITIPCNTEPLFQVTGGAKTRGHVTPRYGNFARKDPFRLGRGSDVFRVLHPRRDVALAVQYTPDIDVVRALDVEDEVGAARQRPGAQARQIQVMRVAR